MTKKIEQNLFQGMVKPVANPKTEGLKDKKVSFKAALQEKSDSSRGAFPIFPQTRTHSKTISTDQAKRLAQYAPIIKNCAIKYNVPIELICGVILHESGGNPRARSPAGAKGLMQLMPGTARRFGVHNSYDPIQNIEGGTKYIRWLLDRFGGNVELTLAGYNAGEGNVEKYGMRIPPFRETQNYVPSVLGYCVSMIQLLREGTAPAPTVLAKAPTKEST